MARLPADGNSVQSSSSGSIQSTPSAAPAAGNMTEQDGGHDEARHTGEGDHLSAKPLAEPVPSAGTAPVLDAHEAAEGCAGDGDEKGQEVESSIPPIQGDGASPTAQVALTASQEACPPVHPELEIGGAAPNDDASMGKKDQSLREDAKLPSVQGVEKPLQAFTNRTACVDDSVDSYSAAETGGTTVVTPPRPSILAEGSLALVHENSGATTRAAGPAVETGVETAEELGGGQALAGQEEESEGEASTPKSPPRKQGRKSDSETDGEQDSEADPEQEDVFIPSKGFTGAKPGYVFKTGDKGLGFYVEGHVDQPVRGKPMLSHRPWNAGPGELAIRRGPLGPIPKPFEKIVPFQTRKEKKAAEESDM